MSQENVEIVREAMEALSESYTRGEATDGLLALCAPDIRVDSSRRVFNPAVYDGHDGVRRSIQEISEDWEDFSQATDRRRREGPRAEHNQRGRTRE
jgi:hypothetical protein